MEGLHLVAEGRGVGMIRCPNCGSTAQLNNFETEYHEYGEVLIAVRWYRCGCGQGFITATTFHSDCDETIEEINMNGDE